MSRGQNVGQLTNARFVFHLISMYTRTYIASFCVITYRIWWTYSKIALIDICYNEDILLLKSLDY